MSDTPPNDKTKQQIRHLRELIAALDKRQPHIERVGETAIARDAAALRRRRSNDSPSSKPMFNSRRRREPRG
jgi:hypothetical protein